MVYDCGACMVKYVLCAFNFIIFIAGTIVLGIGVWLLVDKSSFIGLSKVVPVDEIQGLAQPGIIDQASYILIAIGGCMFLVSFLGYCGALRESQCMLTTYGILLIVILALEIAAGVLATIYKSKAQEETKNVLKTSLEKYYNSTGSDPVSIAWDQLQMNLKCCGVDNYNDYKQNSAWASTGKTVPESCCVLDDDKRPLVSSCTSDPNEVNSYYLKGCYDAIINWIMKNLNIIIMTVGVLALVEVLGVLFSFCLTKSINGYSGK
ncbi:tetraspanin-18-like [Cylas formicarius]|uniref:tetraspanin-18-like n=1 Tax=Cylas formicarius TaxID=197179 RepID=UPI0029588BFB|nr:tetraspanin-18-like [Cylas formicarius]